MSEPVASIPTPFAEHERFATMRRNQLRADVAVMRELGVSKWGDIELGPSPITSTNVETQHQTSPREVEEKRRADMRALHLAAGSGLMPRLGENRIR